MRFSEKKESSILSFKGFSIVLAILLLSITLPSLEGARSKSKKTLVSSPKSSKKKKSTTQESGIQAYESEDTFYARIWQQFQVGDDKEKKAIVSQLKAKVKENPTDGTAHYYLGIMLDEIGSADQAEEHFRAALGAFPDSVDVMARLAEVLATKKKTQEEAFQLYEKILKLDPENGAALSQMGLKAVSEENWEKGCEILTKAVKANPEHRETWKGLGKALLNCKRSEEALNALKKALAFDESDGEVHYLLGKSYEAIGKVKEASDEFAKAKSLGKKEYDLKKLVGFDLARALYETGKTEAAIEEYHKTIKIATEPATGWFELGKIYEDLGKTANAMESYKKCFDLDKKRTEAQFRIGMILKAESKYPDAIRAFEIIQRAKDDWGTKAKNEIEEIKKIMEEEERDKKIEMATSGTDKEREKALLAMLAKDKKDAYALEGLRDFYKETGNFHKSKTFILEMKKAGIIDKDEAERQINDLQTRFDSGEDLAILETRLEDAKRHADWDTAIEMVKRLQEEAKYQLTQIHTNSKNRGQISDKKRLEKLTKLRIQNLKEELQDLLREKKKHK